MTAMLSLTTFAHAFGQRYELPIPLLLFVLGGAGVVLLSFLLVFRREVRGDPGDIGPVDVPAAREFSWIWTVVGLVLFGLFVATGLFGSQEVAENIVPTLFWLIVWIAVPLSCGVLGDWTARLNPFAHIARLAGLPGVRRAVVGRREPLEWPVWLGWWPATGLYFVLACGELIYNRTATLPAVTVAGAMVYFVISAVMGLLYGAVWTGRGEVFSVLFGTWGKLGWFRFGADGRRGFAGGLYGQPFERTASRIAFVMLLLVSVGFDGLLATPLWNRFAHNLPAGISLGSGRYEVFAVGVFAVLTLIFVAVFYSFAAAVGSAGGFRDAKPGTVLAGLLPSLLPISFGYLLAHNIEYLTVNSQLLFPLIGNPVGKEGWPLHLPFPFNDTFEPNPHLLPSSFYWYVSVGLIIAVHIVAVVLAHRHLAGAAPDAVRGQRSELPWVVAMVAYTMLSLWLLAQPLVAEKSRAESLLPAANQARVAVARQGATIVGYGAAGEFADKVTGSFH